MQSQKYFYGLSSAEFGSCIHSDVILWAVKNSLILIQKTQCSTEFWGELLTGVLEQNKQTEWSCCATNKLFVIQ